MMIHRRSGGFTLIELLVVVSILAATAGITATRFYSETGDSVESRARDGLAQAEMLQIAKAVRQFKQDTGFYPGEGPFGYLDYAVCGDSCACDPHAAVSVGGLDPVALTMLAGATDPRDWHESPANLVQLLVRPVICNEHPLARLSKWDANTRRGWRGPYLTREGYTDISGDLQPSGFGSPFTGSILAIRNIPAVADPFVYNEPVPVSTLNVDGDGFLLDWRTYAADTDVYDAVRPGRPGSPYFLFGRDGCTPLRIVSMGADGFYDGLPSNYFYNGTDLMSITVNPYDFTAAADKCSQSDTLAVGDETRPFKEWYRLAVCEPLVGSDDKVMCI